MKQNHQKSMDFQDQAFSELKNSFQQTLSSQDFKSWISRKQKLQIKINSNGSSRCRKKDKQNETHDLNLIGMSKIFVQPFDQVLTSRGSTPSHLRSFSSLSVSLLLRRRGLKKLVRYSFNIQVELFDIKCVHNASYLTPQRSKFSLGAWHFND